MKTSFVFALLFVFFILTACKKNNIGTSAAIPLTGKWAIVSDSTYAAVGPSANGAGYKYIGVAGDIFTFTGNQLFIKEGNLKLDTATYTVVKDTLKLNYTYLNNGGVTIKGAAGLYIIVPIDDQNIELKATGITPAGIINEYIFLTRRQEYPY
jgi:hypothetical protein